MYIHTQNLLQKDMHIIVAHNTTTQDSFELVMIMITYDYCF